MCLVWSDALHKIDAIIEPCNKSTEFEVKQKFAPVNGRGFWSLVCRIQSEELLTVDIRGSV